MTDAEKKKKQKAETAKTNAEDKKKSDAANAARAKKLEDLQVDLSTFKKRDTDVWSEKSNRASRTSSASNRGFGGSRLGGTTRLQRKKNNRSARGKVE